jgi:release factor glutamine methyltransferase
MLQVSGMSFSLNDFHKSVVLKLKAQFPVEEARAMADRLFEHYFRLTPVQRVINVNSPAEETTIHSIEVAVTRLLNHVPLQYLLGSAWFMDMEFDVNPSVLIPRPETEELVSLILNQFDLSKFDPGLRILDIGTGSGCIAIALKHNLPGAKITAIDISHEAIDVAAANAAKNSAEVNFILADIFDQTMWQALSQFDLIVSNPPYVTNSEKINMQRNVLEHEPHTALFVPDDDPLIFYRGIIRFAKIKLCGAGCLWFEINEMFGDALKDIALNQGFKEVNIIFDFRGKSRFLQCFK